MRKRIFVLSLLLLMGIAVPTVFADHRTCSPPFTFWRYGSPLNLNHCNLSFQDLSGEDLSGAIMTNTSLDAANLYDADLSYAILGDAHLIDANLTKADLYRAILVNADLTDADLSDANLSRVDLRGVVGLTDSQLRSAQTLVGVDLSGSDLSNFDLSGVNLSNANLSGATLSGATLSSATLSGADLSNADLTNVIGLTEAQIRGAGTLEGANLSGSNLGGFDLTGVNLSHAKLIGADLRAAVLSLCQWNTDSCSQTKLGGADLSGADMRNVVGLTDWQIRGAAAWEGANMSGLDLRGFNLLRVDLTGANLSEADLFGALLYGANLDGADLTHAWLSNADLTNAILRNAGMRTVRMGTADLVGADLSGADLHYGDMWGADFTGANMSGADLGNADLTAADFSGANLSHAVLRGADVSCSHNCVRFDNANLAYADLSEVTELRSSHLSRAGSLIGINLSRDDLDYFDLADRDLSNANLSDATVRYADLRNANLSNANLSGTNLYSTSLFEADLRDSDLSRARLTAASLFYADLTNANLSYAVLSGAQGLTNSQLRSAGSLIGVYLTGNDLINYNLSSLDLSYATLVNANLVSADMSSTILREAQLRGANLNSANLSDADLVEANLSWTHLRWANLSGADLGSAYLIAADLRDVVNLTDAQLRSVGSLVRANLSGNDLAHYDLSGAFLHLANLSAANLSNANLSEADLSQADLSGANLSPVDLSGADLSDANLSGADLSHANLGAADLSNADLSAATLDEADLRGVEGLADTQLRSAGSVRNIDLRRGNLTDFDLSGVDMMGANLADARLFNANLSHTGLTGASLDGANLWGADLSYADLTGASIDDIYLADADLSYANLTAVAGLTNDVLKPALGYQRPRSLIGVVLGGHDLSGWQLEYINLSEADLSNTSLSGADLYYTNLTGANLRHSDLSHARLLGANLSNADLSGADLFGANLRDVIWSNTVCPDGSNSSASNPETCYRPPLARDDFYYPVEDTAYSASAPGVLYNDSGLSGLTVLLGSGSSHGSLVLNADGSFDYTPDPEFCGSDSFTYYFHDGRADSDIATVSLRVICRNDAPTAFDDSYATDEDTPLTVSAPGVLGNDSDVDGDSLTAAAVVAGPNNGTATVSPDGSFSYTPTADSNGTDSFVYEVCDSAYPTLCDQATVTITVHPVDDRPHALDHNYDTSEDIPLSVPALGVLDTASDADGDALEAVLDGSVGHGSLTLSSDGSFSYSPDPNYCGQDSFTYHADDGQVGSDIATVTINVACVNDLPSIGFSQPSVIADEGQEVVNGGTVSDAEGDTVTLTASVGSVVIEEGLWSWTFPATDGPAQSQAVILLANDGHGGMITDTFSLTVDNVPPSVAAAGDQLVPLGSDGPFELGSFADPGAADGPFVVTVDWGDETADTFSAPATGSLGVLAHSYATAGWYTVQVAVADKDGGSGSAAFQVTVENPLPAITAISPQSAQAGGPAFTLTVEGSEFVPTSKVRWNGTDLETTFRSPTQLQASVAADLILDPQTVEITVWNPPPGGGTSNLEVLFVSQAGVAVGAYESSQSTGGTASADIGTVQADAYGGDGTLILASYDANPAGDPSFKISDTYVDVYLSQDSSFSQVTIVFPEMGHHTRVYWWDGQKWQAASDQTYDALNDTVTVYVSDTTFPSLNDLQGTAFSIGNPLPTLSADPANQTVQYSDPIAAVTLTGVDVGATALELLDTSWTVDGGAANDGLPAGLELGPGACSSADLTLTCQWQLTGLAEAQPGSYVVTIAVQDEGGYQASAELVIAVQPEDAAVTFHGGNPVAVQVDAPSGDSGAFQLTVHTRERYPDAGDGARPGDIALATASVQLVPVGPGSQVSPVSCSEAIHDTGYDARLTTACDLNEVPVNTYLVQVTVNGYYHGGGEDVLTIYDPSLGYATGGGTFAWPGTGEVTDFGFTMEYNNKGKNLKGSLLLIRQSTSGGIYRVKSNALYGLSLGVDGSVSWASFSGKATYLEPGWSEAMGNHEFIVYVQDGDEPIADRFWIEVKDRDREVISAMSMTLPTNETAVPLMSGQTFVP